MPRRASLDAPDTLYYVILRVIEKGRIVTDDDRENFVSRLVGVQSDALLHRKRAER